MKIITADELFSRMNHLGKRKVAFVFLIDAFANKGIISSPDDEEKSLYWETALYSNVPKTILRKKKVHWFLHPVSFEDYQNGFDLAMKHILKGDTYLLNYTCRTKVDSNLSLKELFMLSHAKYRIFMDGIFTCFSPETFIRIEGNTMSSCPMKGTAFNNESEAEKRILENRKELAEHHTIVDLIRNDLSKVAYNVKVERFRYTERINTNREELIQVSSLITGQTDVNWTSRLGDIFSELVPAGSVTGAPKLKTIEIIKNAENYERGWYTGIFGFFDGKRVDSAVLIRFIENQNGELYFKSGGGITFLSDVHSEYNEMIRKVYVPLG